MLPNQKELLGRVLGPSKNEGNKMAQNILKNVHGNVIPRRSVRQLTQTEENSEVEKSKRAEITKIITLKLGNSLYIPSNSNPCKDEAVSGEDDENNLKYLLEEDTNYESNEKTTFEHSLHDLNILYMTHWSMPKFYYLTMMKFVKG